MSMGFSVDGLLLAAGDNKGTAHVWARQPSGCVRAPGATAPGGAGRRNKPAHGRGRVCWRGQARRPARSAWRAIAMR
jgi:hypothetical protein